MRILHLSPSHFSSDSVLGGAERYAYELARAMSVRAEVRFLTFGPKTGFEEDGNLKIYQVKSFLTPAFFSQILWADVIHCHQIYRPETDAVILAGRLFGKKVFATDLGGLGRYSLAYHLPVLRWLTGFLPISVFGERLWVNQGRDRLPQLLKVIGGGVDLEKFCPGKAEKQKKVLFVGRLVSHKGIDLLIDAVDKDTPLEIAGNPYDSDYFEYLKKKSAGKNVRFETGLSDEALVQKYRESAVVVLPSVYTDCFGRSNKAPELLGLTPLEGMACGTPAIVSDTASLPEVVKNGETGFVVPSGDVRALADKINFLLNHPDEADRLGRQGIRFVRENFTWEKTADKCFEAYGFKLGGSK